MPEFGRERDAESLHQRIAERAYALWESQGRPEGRALDHWLQAEAESVAAKSTGSATETRTSRKKAGKKR